MAANFTEGAKGDPYVTHDHRTVRVQLSRKKGWKMPPNTVSVARPTKWGNPFTTFGCMEAGYQGTAAQIRARCAEAFKVWLTTPYWRNNWDGPESEAARTRMLTDLPELRGKSLGCWCPLDQPCHADVLLKLANRPMPDLRRER